MNLDSIPASAAVMIDANIAIYARRGVSAECRRLFERCATREINGYMTTIAVAEFCHRRMMQEAQSQGLVSSNPARALAQSLGLIQKLSQYAADTEDLLAGQLTVLPIGSSDLQTALILQRKQGLMTNDSLHLAVAIRSGITLFVTHDQQFDAVPGISVFKPEDVLT